MPSLPGRGQDALSPRGCGLRIEGLDTFGLLAEAFEVALQSGLAVPSGLHDFVRGSGQKLRIGQLVVRRLQGFLRLFEQLGESRAFRGRVDNAGQRRKQS